MRIHEASPPCSEKVRGMPCAKGTDEKCPLMHPYEVSLQTFAFTDSVDSLTSASRTYLSYCTLERSPAVLTGFSSL